MPKSTMQWQDLGKTQKLKSIRQSTYDGYGMCKIPKSKTVARIFPKLPFSFLLSEPPLVPVPPDRSWHRGRTAHLGRRPFFAESERVIKCLNNPKNIFECCSRLNLIKIIAKILFVSFLLQQRLKGVLSHRFKKQKKAKRLQ
jgi:hypothetical protein